MRRFSPPSTHRRARLLDLGAGTGRIGRPFVAAGDDYVGVDLSLGMLREFARRAGARQPQRRDWCKPTASVCRFAMRRSMPSC